MNIALLQIAPCGVPGENIRKGIEYCRRAKAQGADIALFPEMYSNGYEIAGRTAEELKKDALSLDSGFVSSFRVCAKELDMAIALTILEEHEPAPYNSLLLIDRHGEIALHYRKVHTCDGEGENCLAKGDSFPVASLDTAMGEVRVGAMICFDRAFPESARLLMLQGAELILVPNACTMETNRLAQLRTRAYDNVLAVASCNYPLGVPGCNGHSAAFDCVESHDVCLGQAGVGECLLMARLDLDLMREYRAGGIHANAFRRPDVYKALTLNRAE